MTSLSILQPVPVPSPSDVSGYLLRTGWTREAGDDRWSLFVRHDDGGRVEIEVPMREGARDYPRALAMLVDDLARVEGRAPATVARELRASGRDVVDLVFRGEAFDAGGVDLESGRAAYDAARDLVLAAACAALEPRPVFGRRKPLQAMEHLTRARFAPARHGSYVVSIETPVPPGLDAQGSEDDETAPFERRVNVVLARALAGAHSAATQASTALSMDPFTTRVPDGVSANLCEALASLLSVAPQLKVDFAFARTRPAPQFPRKSLEYAPFMRDVLAEAARQLRVHSPWPDFELEGPVVQLRSPAPEQGGDAEVVTMIDGRARKVSLALGASEYQVAVDAHREGRVIRCVGDLVRAGKGFALQNYRDLRILEDV
ncbi:MAG: hypothetical protein SFX73_27785 [Kofleriaceae bacterium]|nr:hypothetical protein [Kofleriaceae bacterium]